MKTSIIVGDNFECFANLNGVKKISNFVRELEQASSHDDLGKIIIGQGVSESWLNYVKHMIKKKNLKLVISGSSRLYRKASRAYSHKHKRDNILITEPIKIDKDVYSTQLVIDDNCEIMSDHVTGYHLQGMLLNEAARQLFLAATEKFYLDYKQSYYFVINDFNTTYKKFAFPTSVDAEIVYKNIDTERQGRFKSEVEIDFFQMGVCICSCIVMFSAYEKSMLEEKEENMAIENVDQALSFGSSLKIDKLAS